MYNCFTYIHDARTKNENILVHCQQGVSRSASIVIAYLMYSNDITYEESYAHVRCCRPVVSPNTGFIFQLCQWWRDRHCCLFMQQRCYQIQQKYQFQGLVNLSTARTKDSVIRDLQGNHFVQCVRQPRQEARARVYRFSIFSGQQALWLLKREDTVAVGAVKRFLLDPRFLYVVIGLAVGPVLLVGDEAEGLLSIGAQECFQEFTALLVPLPAPL